VAADNRPLHHLVTLDSGAITNALLGFPALASHRVSGADLRGVQARVRAHPTDLAALDALAGALLARADLAGGLQNLSRADGVVQRALAQDPNDYAAVCYQSLVRLAQHRYADAASLASGAIRSAPDAAPGYGVLTVSELALGDDTQAATAQARFSALQPGAVASATAAEVRWTRGEQQGTFQYLRMAINAISPDRSPSANLQVTLGDRYLAAGDLLAAESQYQAVLSSDPHSAAALAGLAALRAAQANPAAAIDLYRRAVDQAPLPSYQEALADLYAQTGQRALAASNLADARAALAAQATAGVDVALDRALLDANHGRSSATDVATARAALAVRHDAATEDAAAWVFYGAGLFTEALNAEDRALTHGARVALHTFHEGMILDRIGHAQEALSFLHEAVMISPAFGPRQVDTAFSEMRRLSAIHSAD
jgi:tetratricopeptide (TPR) repeat protein